MEFASTDLGQELQLLQEKNPCLWLPVKPSGRHQQIINLCHRVWPDITFARQDGAWKRSVSDFQSPVFVTKHDIFNGISLTQVNSWGNLTHILREKNN